MQDCLFCKIVRGEIPAIKEYEDHEIVAFNDISPKAPVHILIIPKKHIASLETCETGDIPVLGRMQLVARQLAETKEIIKKGCRVVVNCNRDAGQEVYHIHYHLLGGRTFSWPPG